MFNTNNYAFSDLSYAILDFCKARRIPMNISDIQASLRTMSGTAELSNFFDSWTATTGDKYGHVIAESIDRYYFSAGEEC